MHNYVHSRFQLHGFARNVHVELINCFEKAIAENEHHECRKGVLSGGIKDGFAILNLSAASSHGIEKVGFFYVTAGIYDKLWC